MSEGGAHAASPDPDDPHHLLTSQPTTPLPRKRKPDNSPPRQSRPIRPPSTVQKPCLALVILLSFFDGIGTAALALQQLGYKIILYWAWEDNADCCTILARHHPQATIRGDFRKETASNILEAIRQVDPAQKAIVLFTGGPPCPDYTRIKGDDALGRQGDEGRKFDEMIDLLDQVIPNVTHRQAILFENVVMASTDAQHFDTRLSFATGHGEFVATHVMGDSIDFGIINRPRFWWSWVPWQQSYLPTVARSALKTEY